MADTINPGAPVCLVSGDRALVHLITTEAQEMAIPLAVAETLTDALDRRPDALLLDLDDADVAEQIKGLSDAVSIIGICRDPDALPLSLTERLQTCLTRPFATTTLREHMSRWSGYSPFVEGEIAQRPTHTPLPAAVPADAVVLSLEGETALRVGSTLVELTPKEAALMRLLIEHRGEIISRETLSEALKSLGRENGDSNKLEVYLCFLRRKIERPLGLRLITTVRGKGYRLE